VQTRVSVAPACTTCAVASCAICFSLIFNKAEHIHVKRQHRAALNDTGRSLVLIAVRARWREYAAKKENCTEKVHVSHEEHLQVRAFAAHFCSLAIRKRPSNEVRRRAVAPGNSSSSRSFSRSFSSRGGPSIASPQRSFTVWRATLKGKGD